MSAPRVQAYRFASSAHWDLCLGLGFDAPTAAGLSLPPRWGAHARRVAGRGPVSAIAADRFSMPVWRSATPREEPGIAWLDELASVRGPFRADSVLAETKRLQVERHWLWGFAADRLVRYDRTDLQHDLILPAAAIGIAEDGVIIDIALDGRGGLWVLLESGDRQLLARVDDCGCARPPMPLPCEVRGATELALAEDGATIALLCAGERRLALVDAGKGSLKRMLWLGSLDPSFQPERLAGDGSGHLALFGTSEGKEGRQWRLFLLDRSGEPLRPAIAGLFLEQDGRAATKTQALDIAVTRDGVWFATTDGVWTLDADPACGSSDAKATLLTTLLHSPPGSDDNGWLRAEIEVELPEGAALTASFATTDDPAIVTRFANITGNESLPKAVRLADSWALLDPGVGAQRSFTSMGSSSFPGRMSIPLFAASQRWLALKLEVDVPPFVGQASLMSLRILYPERTLMRQLPAIFSDPANDPERLLRRLVGVIEATSQSIDETIASIGRHIDAETAPSDWLDYLGSWLDLPWHPALAERSKRALLAEAGYLLRWRGTARGLRRLVKCLAGEGARVVLVDVAAERGPIRLGGKGAAGAPLRGLLAGQSKSVATLGGKAVLGRARLACAGQKPGPLDILVPLILIEIDGDAATKAANAPYLAEVLDGYAPIGLRHRVRWTADGRRDADDVEALVLEAQAPGMLGTDCRIGQTVLAGRARTEIGEGFHMGFHIR